MTRKSNDFNIQDGSGQTLTHRNYFCTVCDKEHHIFVPPREVDDWDLAIGQLLEQGTCPESHNSECARGTFILSSRNSEICHEFIRQISI